MATAKTPASLKIGEVARQSGVAVETLRFYETRGLIEPVSRTETGYRLYDSRVLSRLSFIKKAQSIGFSLDEIAKIVADSKSGTHPCADVRRLAEQKLAELDRRIQRLQRYRRELRNTVSAWERVGEAEGDICGLIEGLSEPLIQAAREKL